MSSFFIDSRMVRFFNVEKGRNAGIILVFGAFPLRILKHRGWNNEIYRRVMEDSEIEMVQQSRRLISWRYDDLASCLIDELNVLGVGKSFDIESDVLCRFFSTSMSKVVTEWSDLS